MKNKKTLIINILSVVWFVIACAFVVFCFQVTVLEGLGTIDIGEAYPDIDPYNIAIWGFQSFSPLGLIPIFAPVMVLLILSSIQSKQTRELLLFALLLITLISYNDSINHTWAFLLEKSTEVPATGRYTTGMIYPIAFIFYIAISLAFQQYIPSPDEQEG